MMNYYIINTAINYKFLSIKKVMYKLHLGINIKLIYIYFKQNI